MLYILFYCPITSKSEVLALGFIVIYLVKFEMDYFIRKTKILNVNFLLKLMDL